MGKKCIGKFCNIVANPINPMPFIGTQKTLPTLPPVVIQPISSSSVGVVFGKKRYEISDWLGNVRVVINDRKTPVNIGTTTVGYKAQVVSVSDYYSFGGEIAERTYDPVKPFYRFGFNTQEKTFELNRGHYTAKFWEYDARARRRWNRDPKPLANESEYAVNRNNPVLYSDLMGKSGEVTIDKESRTITITSHLVLYGSAASAELAKQTAADIQNKWNEANGKVTIDGIEYSVRFVIIGKYNPDITPDQIRNNTDIKMNFIRVEETASGNISYMDGLGANYWLLFTLKYRR